MATLSTMAIWIGCSQFISSYRYYSYCFTNNAYYYCHTLNSSSYSSVYSKIKMKFIFSANTIVNANYCDIDKNPIVSVNANVNFNDMNFKAYMMGLVGLICCLCYCYYCYYLELCS